MCYDSKTGTVEKLMPKLKKALEEVSHLTQIVKNLTCQPGLSTKQWGKKTSCLGIPMDTVSHMVSKLARATKV